MLGAPAELRQQFWQLVVPIALRVKDHELAEGLDADGDPLKPISAKTRKYRKSAMTPDGLGDPDAPPLMPAYQKSRVRSLLAGRAFSTHCELYWRFDPFTGRSFDVILTYQVEMGRNVFGVSDEGLREIRVQSWAAWTKWKKTGAAPIERRTAFASHALTQGPQPRIAGIIARSTEPGAGSRATKAVGALETRHLTLGIGAPTAERLKASTTRSGMMTGEEWRKYFTTTEVKAAKPRAPKIAPLVKVVAPPTKPRPGKVNLPVTQFIPAAQAVPIINRAEIERIAAAAPKGAISPVPVGLLRVQADKVGALQDLINQRITEFYKGNPPKEPIIVIFEDGLFFVHEGHHRAAAAIMRGDFSLPGLIFQRVPGTQKDAQLMVMDADGNLHPHS